MSTARSMRPGASPAPSKIPALASIPGPARAPRPAMRAPSVHVLRPRSAGRLKLFDRVGR